MAPSLRTRLQETLRLQILQFIEELESRSIDEDLLAMALADIEREQAPDVLRAELTWLDRQGLITLTRFEDAGRAWVAHLTQRGDLCARGVCEEPGVARPRLRK